MNKALELSQDSTPDAAAQPASGMLATVTELPQMDRVPDTLQLRLALARKRLQYSAEHGIKVLMYEVALDLDMSEFHFARQFRAAFGCSPHAYYDEVRAARARDLLNHGIAQGQVARLIRLRRPAELRDLLRKRQQFQCMTEVLADTPTAPAAKADPAPTTL